MKKYIYPFFLCLFHDAFLVSMLLFAYRNEQVEAGISMIMWFVTFHLILFGYAVGRYTLRNNRKSHNKLLEYTYIDNSILLKTEKINAQGFYEVWRQRNLSTGSTQILCYNTDSFEFQAFDRYRWMEEVFPYDIKDIGSLEDLWTPIRLHYTHEWLNAQLSNCSDFLRL